MLYTKIQPKSFLGSGEEDFSVFLPYMGMVHGGHLVQLCRNLVKIAQAVSEKKFKNYTILYMYIAQWQG